MNAYLCGADRIRHVTVALVVASLVLAAANAAARDAGSPAPVVALAAAGAGHVLLKAETHALYRSGDEGRTWQRVSLPKAASDGAIASVAVAARGNQVLYIAGRNLGVWRSRDGGRSWVAKNVGLPSTAVQAVTTHADQADTVYAYVPQKGIFRSDDAGDHWRLMDAGPRETIVRFVHSNMPGSMQTGWLFAATAKGVNRSMDCFCGWRDAGALNVAVTTVAYDPSEPKRVYATTGNGLLVTEDGGEHWSKVAAPGAATAALVVGADGTVYAADNQGTLSRSSDHGHSWLRLDE